MVDKANWQAGGYKRRSHLKATGKRGSSAQRLAQAQTSAEDSGRLLAWWIRPMAARHAEATAVDFLYCKVPVALCTGQLLGSTTVVWKCPGCGHSVLNLGCRRVYLHKQAFKNADLNSVKAPLLK